MVLLSNNFWKTSKTFLNEKFSTPLFFSFTELFSLLFTSLTLNIRAMLLVIFSVSTYPQC